MVVNQATPGQAFDVNQPLSSSEAAAFKGAGYDTAIRYFPRVPTSTLGNLTNGEIKTLIEAGLSLLAVQHVAYDNWMPTAELGTDYGKYGGSYLNLIGYPSGAAAFLDLEMVNKAAKSADIIAYCNNWFDQITSAGFQPGIYIGYQSGLNDNELYESLKFKSYWKGYNCDQSIPNRGWQIIQHTQKSLNAVSYDPNTISADWLGGLPMVVSAS